MKRIFFIAVFLVIAGAAFAQSKRVVAFHYNMAFSNGEVHDFISKPGVRGFNVDYREILNNSSFGLGVDIGWNVFHEEMPDDAVYQYNDNIDYSGKQFRYYNTVPTLVTVDYFINADKKVTPYAGFGIGMVWNEARVDMGLYSFSRDAFQFALKPEFGLLWDVSQTMALSFNAKYFVGIKGGDLPTQSYFNLGIGLAFVK